MFACWLVDLEEVSSLHKGWAKPGVIWSGGERVGRWGGQMVVLSSLPSFFSQSIAIWGWDFKWSGERETETGGQDLNVGRSLCAMAGRNPLRWPVSALEQSRTLGPTHTSCHCCLLHRPGTDTAHCTAWTTHSNSATFHWPTIGKTSAWPIGRSPTASHSTGRLCITPIVVLIVVPLLWWYFSLLLPPPLMLFQWSSPLSLLSWVDILC